MKKHIVAIFAATSVALAIEATPLDVNGVFQWGVEVRGVVSRETGKPPRAWLWIPEGCTNLSAVVIGNDNMLEETLLTRGDFRAELVAADCGILWVSSGFQGFNAKFGAEDWPIVQGVLDDLAAESGYAELASTARLVPLGHSAWADWPYFMAAAKPKRMAGAVSLKGSWPHRKPWYDEKFAASVASVPKLLVAGEYENFANNLANEKIARAEDFRVECDWGSGHFEYTDDIAVFLGKWIAAVVRGNDSSRVGVPWPQEGDGGKFAVIGYCDGEGGIIAQNPKYHLQVTIPYKSMDASGAFRVETCFEHVVPPGRPEVWTGRKAGDTAAAPNAAFATNIVVKVIQGPGVARGDGTIDVRFNRHGFYGYRAREIVLAAIYPGDGEFKRSPQQAILRIPLKVHEGGNVDETTQTGAFVREGPAYFDKSGKLVWTRLPPKSRRPAVATICRYRYNPAAGEMTFRYSTVTHPSSP